jgi:hypothetical protein
MGADLESSEDQTRKGNWAQPFARRRDRAQDLALLWPLLREIIILLRDTGVRPKKELFPMRIRIWTGIIE